MWLTLWFWIHQFFKCYIFGWTFLHNISMSGECPRAHHPYKMSCKVSNKNHILYEKKSGQCIRTTICCPYFSFTCSFFLYSSLFVYFLKASLSFLGLIPRHELSYSTSLHMEETWGSDPQLQISSGKVTPYNFWEQVSIDLFS